MLLVVKPVGIAGEFFVVDSLKMGQFGEEEAKEVQVQDFLAVLGRKPTDREFFDRSSEIVVSEGSVADSIIVADETTQLEALEVERM